MMTEEEETDFYDIIRRSASTTPSTFIAPYVVMMIHSLTRSLTLTQQQDEVYLLPNHHCAGRVFRALGPEIPKGELLDAMITHALYLSLNQLYGTALWQLHTLLARVCTYKQCNSSCKCSFPDRTIHTNLTTIIDIVFRGCEYTDRVADLSILATRHPHGNMLQGRHNGPYTHKRRYR